MKDDVQYIASNEGLAAWVARLEAAPVIAIDTESDSFHHYREKLCLIQMTALGEDVILDPLAIQDLTPLAKVLACPERVKIFHDAGYDLVCLRRDFGFVVQNIFDTMLAGRILGLRQFGLAAMLQQAFGFVADKRYQRSDWSKRPLSAGQLHYARYDTHFLPALRERLMQQLGQVGRLDWAQEEFTRLPALAAAAYGAPRLTGKDAFWRIQGSKDLDAAGRGRLAALQQAREALAEALDRPAFKVLHDSVLLQLAQTPPKTPADLRPTPGLRQHAIDKFGAALLTALAGARPIEGPPPKQLKRRRSGRLLDPEARERYEALREVRRQEAQALDLEPEVVLSNAVLASLACVPPTSRGALLALEAFQGWRGATLADGFYACVRRFAAVQNAAATATDTAAEDTPQDAKPLA